MMVNTIRSWLRSLFLRGRLEREMQEEMKLHLERASKRLLARGLSPEDARKAARREFGNVEYLQEQARDARGSRWLETLLADVRFGLRHFARTPLSTITMIIVLALGIGANTVLVTVFHSLKTMPPPGVTQSDALVRIRGLARGEGKERDSGRALSYPEVQSYAAQRNLFSAVAAWSSSDVVLDVGDREQGVLSGTALFVTDNYFRVLGVKPILGSGLPGGSAGNWSAPPMVAVIGHRFWSEVFGRSPDVLGKIVRINDVSTTIVGVAPPEFGGAGWSANRALWLPLAARSVIERSSPTAFSSHDSTFLSVVARLQPNRSAEQVLPAVRAIAARFPGEWGSGYLHREGRLTGVRIATSADVVPVLINNDKTDTFNEMAFAFAGGSAIGLLILLVTCTTVSSLLVGLAVARRREIAVRLSLGAARMRLVRQLLTESALLALAASLLAVFVIWVVMRILTARNPDIPFVWTWPSAVFAFALALATGVIFGVSPALHATRLAVSDVLKDSAKSVSASRSWLQRGLVVAQIALTQPLLVGLGASMLSILPDLRGGPGQSLEDQIVQVGFDTWAGTASEDQTRETLRRMEERFAALPGVAATSQRSFGVSGFNIWVHPEDQPANAPPVPTVYARVMSAPRGYFRLMDVPILYGRDFAVEEQHKDATSIVIDRDLASQLWNATNPVGKRLLRTRGLRGEGDTIALTVVGVVDDAGIDAKDERSKISVYVPYQNLVNGAILVRTRGPARPIIPLLRSVARTEAPQLPIMRAETLADISARSRSAALRAAGVAAGCGLLAMFLSAIGLYAVISFAVGQRRREIGIRTALGARRAQVVGMFFFRGLRVSALGLFAGLPLGIIAIRLATRGISAMQVSAPALALSIACVVMSVAALASWIPARHAAGIDPLESLRAE